MIDFIYYYLSQKFKQLGNGEVNHLTIILTFLLTCGPSFLLNKWGPTCVSFIFFYFCLMRGREELGFKISISCSHTLIYYQLSQLTLLGNCEFNHYSNKLEYGFLFCWVHHLESFYLDSVSQKLEEKIKKINILSMIFAKKHPKEVPKGTHLEGIRNS